MLGRGAYSGPPRCHPTSTYYRGMATPPNNPDSRVTSATVEVGAVTIHISPLGDLSIWTRGHSTHVRIQHADIDDLEHALRLARKELPNRDRQK